MFTGIIEGVGTVRSAKRKGGCAEIEISCGFDLEKTNVGDSISVNGCCLVVSSRLGRSFWTEIPADVMEATTLGNLKEGDPVNLERALKVGSRLGGHIVQGHVDGTGKVVDVKRRSKSHEFIIEAPANLSRYIVEKGSVAVDGASLTVICCEGNVFSVKVVPHAQLKTTFQELQEGGVVNLEVDIIGKYVEKMAFLDSEQYRDRPEIAEEFLKKHGF